jgi:hypothetical protein
MNLHEQLDVLPAHIRDASSPPPPGLDARRLQVYRDLFHNSLFGLLAANFPVIRKLYGEGDFRTLVREFYRDFRCTTPLFPELPREFLQYLQQRADAGHADPPWLRELAHYEWAELALDLSEADPANVPHDAAGDLLAGWPVVSPLCWALAYAWPVHRLAPGHVPEHVPAMPTFLLVRRDATMKVRFDEISALTFRLLHALAADSHASGRELLQSLAIEAAAEDVDAFVTQGAAMLHRLHAEGVVLGTRPGA